MKTYLRLAAFLFAITVRTFAGPLDGIWLNTDKATRSIPKIEISSSAAGGAELVVWTRTHPADSRYGPFKLALLGDSVGDPSPNKYGYATHEAGFANMFYVIRLSGQELAVESLTIFKDGSKRANYREALTFKKQP